MKDKNKEIEKEQKDQPKLEEKAQEKNAPDPTRYGDWEKDGRCIDF